MPSFIVVYDYGGTFYKIKVTAYGHQDAISQARLYIHTAAIIHLVYREQTR
jgi:hypothetical protein